MSNNKLEVGEGKSWTTYTGRDGKARKRFIRFREKRYPGVYYIIGEAPGLKTPEKIYYIYYRNHQGRQVEEKAGRQHKHGMTAAKAARIRNDRMGGAPSNRAQRLEKIKKTWTIDKLWQEYKKQKPDLKGIVQDENRFNNYLSPVFGNKEPIDLSPLDVDRLRIKLQKANKSPSTIKNVLELLRRIVNFGSDKHLCPGPDFKIKLPRVDNQTTEYLTLDQIRDLLEAIQKDPDLQAGGMMKLALFTGMRRGEMFRLRWEDVDFSTGFLNIRNPKGGVDQKIPMSSNTRKFLKSHPKTKSPFVFPGNKGEQRVSTPHGVKRIKKAAGLPDDFRELHGLRHTFASMLASSGQVDLHFIQRLLTHKSPQMTQRYAHLRDEALQNAADVAAQIIEGALDQLKGSEREAKK